MNKWYRSEKGSLFGCIAAKGGVQMVEKQSWCWSVIFLDGEMCFLLRRAHPEWSVQESEEHRVYRTLDLIMDLCTHTVYKCGLNIHLSAIEFEILLVLLENCRQICTRQDLMEICEDRFHHLIAANTLSKHIHRLREKLCAGNGTAYVQTHNAIGYKWSFPVEALFLTRNEQELPIRLDA